MKRYCLIAVLAWFACPSALFAQFSVGLDPATTRFTYFPSGKGPGVPGGIPDAYELHFGMRGMLTIEEQTEGRGKITQADFVLLGNDVAFQNDPQRRAQLEETSRQILLTAVFDVERGPPLDRTVFRAEVAGPDLVLEFFRQQLVRMDGGPDLRPVDGEGFRYSYPVPEPATPLLVLGAFAGAGLRRKRGVTFACPLFGISRGRFRRVGADSSHNRPRTADSIVRRLSRRRLISGAAETSVPHSGQRPGVARRS
jgi:hypothetical protein